jgi:hypothetical protein
MRAEDSPLCPARRDFLRALIPVCALPCVGSRVCLASGSSGGDSEQPPAGHKFDTQVDWTMRQVFERQYGTYIDRMNRLADFIGRGQLLAFLKKSTEDFYRSRATYKPGNTLAAFVKPFRESDYYRTILTIVFLEDTERVVSWRLTECLHATVFRDNDAADIGFATLCHGDEAWVTAYNPNIEFHRTKTLMEGHDCCDHRYVFRA